MTFIAGIQYIFPTVRSQTNICTESPNVEMIMKLGYLGSRSFQTHQQLICPGDSEPFVSNTKFWVYMDRKSRKISPLPQWFIDKYDRQIPSSPRLKSPAPATRETFASIFLVQAEDIDGFGHTNFEVYIKYIVNTLKEASVCGQAVSKDIITSDIKTVDILFHRESKAGDRLTINVWQTESGDLSGEIVKDNNTLITCRIELDKSNCTSSNL